MEFDLDALRAVFLAEAGEQLAEMERSLLALERRPDDAELVASIFRVAHTLKGNAATLGLMELSRFTHSLEEMLHRVRSGAAGVTSELITLLLESLDVLREMVPRAVAGNDALTPGAEGLLDRIRESAERRRGAPSPAPAAPAPEPRAPEAHGEALRTLRVETAKLDRMLDLVGEIAVSRGRLRQALESGAPAGIALEVQRETDRLEMDLQELVMKVRMVPVAPVFHGFARTVRDVAALRGRQARLELQGEEVELDVSVVEPLRDALLHVIRNAVDHGIESPEARRAAGKGPAGTIRLSAAHEASALVITVSDDGAGLDREKILERARARGLVAPGEEPADDALFDLVFQPGFSTAASVTDVSGRGVGMDVVRRNVDALHGRLDLTSRAGEGTTLRIRLPLTLAIIDGFVVGTGRERWVLPMDGVVECVALPRESAGDDAACVIPLRGEPLPCVRLRTFFGEAVPAERPVESVVVVRTGEGYAGLVVDALFGQSQVVIKPLSSLFRDVPFASGSCILGDGRVALILDLPRLMRRVLQEEAAAVPA